MSQPKKYFKYLYYDLSNFYLMIQKGNQFYLGIQDGVTGACYTKPMKTKIKRLIYFRN